MSAIPLYKDGDSEEIDVYTDTITIQATDNGWIVRITDSKDDEEVNVFVSNRDEIALIELVKNNIGI